MSQLIIALSALLLCVSVHARRPAVEPVMGLSIEEIPPVPPEKARGQDFSDQRPQRLLPEAVKAGESGRWTDTGSSQVPSTTYAELVGEEADLVGRDGPGTTGPGAALLLIVLLVLPGMIWFTLMRKIERSSNAPSEMGAVGPTLRSEEERERQEQEEQNWPKAS